MWFEFLRQIPFVNIAIAAEFALSVLSEIGPSRAIRAAAMLSGPFVPEFAINIKINPDNKS